jgi:membrane protein DedA with SNARE-associated domain
MHFDAPAILALFNLDFEHVRPWLQSGGYGLLFLLLFACGLGLPLPEDIPLVTAGILISQHHMNIFVVAPVAWLGIMGGDTVLYTLGYRFGRNITLVPVIGKHVTAARLDKVEVLFAKWGIWVIAVGRMFAGIRGAMVVAAGTTRFHFGKFIVADGLAAIVSGGMFVSLGFWFGSNMDAMWHKAHEFKLALAVGGLLLFLGIFLYVRWKAGKQKAAGDVIAEKGERAVSEG